MRTTARNGYPAPNEANLNAQCGKGHEHDLDLVSGKATLLFGSGWDFRIRDLEGAFWNPSATSSGRGNCWSFFSEGSAIGFGSGWTVMAPSRRSSSGRSGGLSQEAQWFIGRKGFSGQHRI